ncbi:MAG TPA: hypothetical protein VN428_25105 [Bryobacteraceae bacterium]|nr:hypothetical protein [Bryobacteraceae bacterium]
MGHWTLHSMNPAFSPLDGETFGNNFQVTFMLRYSPSTFGSFAELPRLDWSERIFMKEHTKGEHWEYEGNQYERLPYSPQFKVWSGRYVEAYGRDIFPKKGHCRLLDGRGVPVAPGALNAAAENGEAADAVRSYLKSHGGFLEIEIHDVPAIRATTDGRKERLLLFNCGLVGGAQRVYAEQYLDVDPTKPRSTWLREFRLGYERAWSTRGLRPVPPPDNVTRTDVPIFGPGFCW